MKFLSVLLMPMALLFPWLALSAPAVARPNLPEQVRAESAFMTTRYAPIAKKYHLTLISAMTLATRLGARDWMAQAGDAGITKSRQKALWQDLNALPHPNFDQLTPYNLLAPAHDRWHVSIQEGVGGWKRYGELIEREALAQGLDPAILGAYVWTESNFDTKQLTRDGSLIAVGLGSVQAQDYAWIGKSLKDRIHRLQDDPALNLSLTALEFKAKWNPQDMFGTVMDVWYPSWRNGQRFPNLGNAFGYVQLFSNRYFMLLQLTGT
jgi:hypothetical protein